MIQIIINIIIQIFKLIQQIFLISQKCQEEEDHSEQSEQ